VRNAEEGPEMPTFFDECERASYLGGEGSGEEMVAIEVANDED
jgi:hypothetical protein